MNKIAIIGAGPAGLTSAWELLKSCNRQYEVIVFEESNVAGGISRTIRFKGNRMDIGGHRFFSKNPEVMEWWKNMMPLQGQPASDDIALGRSPELAAGGPDPECADRVMLIRTRVSRILFNRKFFDYPLRIKLATFLNLGPWRTISSAFSYLAAKLRRRPEENLEDFYINRFGRVVYSMFFESYTKKVWGRHPSQMSAAWGSQRVKGLSVSRLLVDGIRKLLKKKHNKNTETSLIEQFWYPKYGPGQLWETVAQEIIDMGGKILYNHKVENVIIKDDTVQGIVVYNQNERKKFECDVIISSMPLKELIQAIIPPAPAQVKRIAEGLPYRDFITVGILAKKLRLRNTSKIKTTGSIVPDCWIYIQEPDFTLGRLQIFNNWSPYMVADPKATVWIGCEYFCDENDILWNKTNEEMQRFAISELVSLGIIEKQDVLDSCCEKVKKAYPAYFGTYAELDVVYKYINSVNGLYCVGRNGQHRYNNMDHSMLTSFFCVRHIINHRQVNKDDIWRINTESEYHEENK